MLARTVTSRPLPREFRRLSDEASRLGDDPDAELAKYVARLDIATREPSGEFSARGVNTWNWKVWIVDGRVQG